MIYFAPDRGGAAPESGSAAAGNASPDSLLEVLTLPEDQRQLMLWLVRQGTVALGKVLYL